MKADVCLIYVGVCFSTSSRPLLNLFDYIIYPGKILGENRTYEKQNSPGRIFRQRNIIAVYD